MKLIALLGFVAPAVLTAGASGGPGGHGSKEENADREQAQDCGSEYNNRGQTTVYPRDWRVNCPKKNPEIRVFGFYAVGQIFLV